MTLNALPRTSDLSVRSIAASHVGAVRSVNEDRFLDRPDLGVWAISDGMGGHRNGAEAAQHVIDAIDRVGNRSSGYAQLIDIRRSLDGVNERLFRDVDQMGRRSGATVAALIIREGHFACLWSGDSRLYLHRAGVLTRLSRDHSVVQELIDSGSLHESDRYRHPASNVVTQVIGGAPQVYLETSFGIVESGDRFLLCSDGLTCCLTERKISELAQLPQIDILKEALNLSQETNAVDNISLIHIIID